MDSQRPGGEDDQFVAEVGLGRLLALSDGVFAIAITLLVLNLSIPAGENVAHALRDVGPRLWAAALSFAVIGRYWLAHHRMYSYIQRADTALLVLNVAFLAPIVMMPFTTELLADYGKPVSVMAYAGSNAAAGVLETALWIYATFGRRLVHAALPAETVAEGLVGNGVVALVFLASIPVALASRTAAELCWVLLLAARGTLLVPPVIPPAVRLVNGEKWWWFPRRAAGW